MKTPTEFSCATDLFFGEYANGENMAGKNKKTDPENKSIVQKVAGAIKNVFSSGSDEELEKEWDERMAQKIEENSPEAIASKKQIEETQLNNRLAEYDDRMTRYMKQEVCPKCKAFPVVCTMRRPGYRAFRCRECGYKWEVKLDNTQPAMGEN